MTATRTFRILYYLGKFPSISETFIVNQMVDMLRRGHEIAIYSLKQNNVEALHDKIRQYGLMEKTTFAPVLPSSFAGRARMASRSFRLTPLHVRMWSYLSSVRRFGYAAAVPFRRFVYAQHLAEHMNRFQPDILHAHFGLNAILPMCVQKSGVCRSAGMIVTFHGCDLHGVRRNTYRDLFRHANRFTVNSLYAHNVAAAIGCPDEKLVRIPMGVDCNQFMPGSRQDEKDGNAVTILFVGRLVEIKGVDVAIRAVARLREICDAKIRLIVVGDGVMRADAEQLVDALDLRGIVAFRGALSQEETIRCFADSDIFLFSGVTDSDGRQEAQGLVIQEAQAMELPVVVSDVGGAPEGMVHGETGTLCPERDVDAMAKALCYLVTHSEERIAMGEKGRRFVKENFEIGVLGDTLEQLYRSVWRNG